MSWIGFEKLDFLPSIGPASIGLTAFNGLWNYDGWNQLNFVAEEIKEPMKNLPRAILISMPIVVIVYVLMNVSYLSAMSPKELRESGAVGVVRIIDTDEIVPTLCSSCGLMLFLVPVQTG